MFVVPWWKYSHPSCVFLLLTAYMMTSPVFCRCMMMMMMMTLYCVVADLKRTYSGPDFTGFVLNIWWLHGPLIQLKVLMSRLSMHAWYVRCWNRIRKKKFKIMKFSQHSWLHLSALNCTVFGLVSVSLLLTSTDSFSHSRIWLWLVSYFPGNDGKWRKRWIYI